ncbi:MAG: response regulator [Limnothrix sp. RL_2_0]|nr:response regulator [Limnothrix sp. RL_2_0]
MLDLEKFNLKDMVQCSLALRNASDGARSMEEVAKKIVDYFYTELITPEDHSNCALIRFFKTHQYADLEPSVQQIVQQSLALTDPHPELKCLTLLASRGVEPNWNDRHQSTGHQAIPLATAETIRQIPMMAQLMYQFGLSITELLQPNPEHLLELSQKEYNVFFVPEALGSVCIPGQENFVIPYGVKSVLAFGGLLPDGELFTVILFSRVAIKRAIAEMFQPLSLSVKLAILPFANKAIFRSAEPPFPTSPLLTIRELKSQITALEQLLLVSDQATLKQSQYLEKTISDLRISQQAAEAANIAKSDFLATMSHEIRTPMNAVIGMTDLLLDTEFNQQQYEFVEIIQNSGNALLEIINDILDFSKIDAKKMDLEQNPFNLQVCLNEVLDLFSHPAYNKNIELIYSSPVNVPEWIEGDITRLRQILVNLLSNALKFTETGEIVLSVTSQGLPDSRCQLHFLVRDTGIGIPQDRQQSLFQPFSQIDSSTTRKYGGTGLGLVISRRLAALMDGKLWCESELDQGSTFFCTIVVPKVIESKTTKSINFCDKHILVVDNNVTACRVLAQQLEQLQAQVTTSHGAASAIAKLGQYHKFDAVLIDWQMPDIDGIELATHIRSLPDGHRLPLVLLSSHGLPAAATLKTLAIAAILSKPIKPQQLATTLHKVLFSNDSVASTNNPNLAIAAPTAKKSSLKILLAEDNIVNQKVAILTLNKLGYQADIASNGQEAIAAIQNKTYDVILMDVQMPQLDGIQATQWIRENYTGKQPTIIAITANVATGNLQTCIDVGMNDFIAKPIRPEAIKTALQNL